MFSCFRKPNGDDTPRGQYLRRSSSGGHGAPVSENSNRSTSRGLSEPPPRVPKKIGAFRSALAAAGSSKTKFIDTFKGRRPLSGRRYISMRLPSDTNLPSHVPRSLGRGRGHVPADRTSEDDWLQAATPNSRSHSNHYFTSASSMTNRTSVNSAELPIHRATQAIPQPTCLHQPSDPRRTPSDHSLTSTQASLRPSPSATLHTTANHAPNAPPSPSHPSALYYADPSQHPPPDGFQQPLRSSPFHPPHKHPSDPRCKDHSSSPKHGIHASQSSISIPLEAGSQLYFSTHLGDTLQCQSSFQSNPADATASHDAHSQHRAAVMSEATSGTSLLFRDSRGAPVGRSTQSQHSSTQHIRDSITSLSGVATLEAHSCSHGGMNSTATASCENNTLTNTRNTASAAPSGARTPNGHSGASSRELSGCGGGGSSNYFAPGFALLPFSAQPVTQPCGRTYEDRQQGSRRPSICVSAANSSPHSSHQVAPSSPSRGNSSPESRSSPPLTQPWQLHAPATPTPMPVAAHASMTGAAAAARSPEFATPSAPSRGLSPEFATPQAPISPERMSILSSSSLSGTQRPHVPQGRTPAQQQPAPQCAAGSSGRVTSHRGTLPSPAHLLRILPSTSKSASAQPLEASLTRRCQSYPHDATAHHSSATPESASQQTTPLVPGSSRSVGGLSPPASLNLELSTPESRPLLTPDQRHTFSSHTTHAGFMGCVDNPVFSTEDASKATPPGLSISAARTCPGGYHRGYVSDSTERSERAQLQVEYESTDRTHLQAEYGAVSDSEDIAATSTSSIAAAAARVAAMREREQRAQSCSKRMASEEQQWSEEKPKGKKKPRQTAVDEAAEFLFSTADSAFGAAESESPPHSESQENEFMGHMNENQDENVPSPAMPHTVSTKGSSKQPKALPPVHKLPELSLRPSAAKQPTTQNGPGSQSADVRVSHRSQSSSAHASAPSSEGASEGASRRGAIGRSFSVTLRNGVTAALPSSTQNISEASNSGMVPPTDAADAVCAPSAAYARADKILKGSKTNSQGGSRGHGGSSGDTFATVGSRVRGRDDSCAVAGCAGPSSSLGGSSAMKSNSRAPLGHAYTANKPGSSSGKLPNTSVEALRYVPPDLPSATNTPPKSGSTGRNSGSTGRRSGSSGGGDSVSVRMKPSSLHSNSSSRSKPAPRPESSAASDRQPGSNNTLTTKFSSAGAATVASGSATLAPSEAHDSISDQGPVQCTRSAASLQRVVNRGSSRSAGSGASETDSQYLDAMMNTTRSALELDFCSGDLSAHSRLGGSTMTLRQKKPLQVAPEGMKGASGRENTTASLRDSDKFDRGAAHTSRHIHGAAPHGHVNADEAVVCNEAGESDDEAQDDGPEEPADCPDQLLRGEISDLLEALPSPSAAHSPVAACSSLPMVSPEAQPRIGDILGGRFLLRRIVGTSPSAIIYGANDLQEGSMPCSIRMPAPNTPLAASMIALGRMQWLRGKLSHSDGATSLVRILSMPNLLGHGIVVATECLEASVRGRMNLIACGKARPFSNSDLRSLARQLLKGLNFMHESGIVHGDITPDSLFFKSEQGAQIRFVDLGCGCFPTSDPTPIGNGTYKRSPKSAYNMSSVGSFWSNTGALSQKGRGSVRELESEEDDIDTAAALCRAPEAFFTPPIVSEKMDVWSVGCLLYQMETGEPLGQEPQQEPLSPDCTSPSHYHSDSNSFWEDPQTVLARGPARRPASGLKPNLSAEFSEELLYGTLPGHSRTHRLSPPLRSKRHTISTPDSAGAVAAFGWHSGMQTFHEDQPDPSTEEAGSVADGAAVPGRSMPVVSAPGSAADPGAGGLSGAAWRARDDGLSAPAGSHTQHKRSSASAELLVQMRACERVLEDAKQLARGQTQTLNACKDSASEAQLPRCQSPAGMFVTRARPAGQHALAQQGDGAKYHTDPVPAHGAADFDSTAEPDTVPSPSSAYPSLLPQRVHRKLGSIGKLKPPADFPRTAPASVEPKEVDWGQQRRSVVEALKSSLWEGGSKTVDSRTTSRSAAPPAPASAQPSHAESVPEVSSGRRSRGARRGTSSRWGFRSLSGARNRSPGHSNSLHSAMQSFRSNNDASPPPTTGASFMNALEELETTVDLPLTISARESYSSLPSMQALTRRASLRSQSGRVTGMSGALSGGLSGALGSQHGGHSRPGSARAGCTGEVGISCRPWLAQRLGKIKDREFARFLSAMLECSFMSRPTASQALQHSWLSYGGGVR